jgi:hypothetical protein
VKCSPRRKRPIDRGNRSDNINRLGVIANSTIGCICVGRSGRGQAGLSLCRRLWRVETFRQRAGNPAALRTLPALQEVNSRGSARPWGAGSSRKQALPGVTHGVRNGVDALPFVCGGHNVVCYVGSRPAAFDDAVGNLLFSVTLRVNAGHDV